MGAGTRHHRARRALFHRGREEFAACREDHALPGRRDVEVLDVAGRRDPGGSAVEAVGGDGDLDGNGGPVAVRVEQMQRARLLEDDPSVRVGARPAEVPGVRFGPGPGLAAPGVVGIQVVRAPAVGGEEDPGSDPHRVAVGARVVGDLCQLAALQLEDVEVLRPAAGVALPGAEVPEERRIDHAAAVRRPGPGPGARHRERRGEPPAPRHLVEPALGHSVAVPERAEEDALAVRRPVVDDVVEAPAGRHRPGRRIERQLLRGAAPRRHHVDLLVAVVLAGEGDLAPVGREPREEFAARVRRQPHCGATGDRGRPQVAGVGEDDAVPVDIGEAEQPRLGAGGLRQRRQGGGDQEGGEGAHLGFPRRIGVSGPPFAYGAARRAKRSVSGFVPSPAAGPGQRILAATLRRP